MTFDKRGLVQDKALVSVSRRSKARILLGKASALLISFSGCLLLYLGCGMLLVPNLPGEPDRMKVIALWNVLPITFSIVCFVTAGWIWSRVSVTSLGKSIAVTLFISIGGVVLFFVLLALGAKFAGY
jgi:hypothetical protein